MSGDELRADPELLDRVASGLRTAGDRVAALGDSVPGEVDAGELSGLMAGVLGTFATGAAEFAVGLLGAGDLVAQGRAEYVETDGAVADALSTRGG